MASKKFKKKFKKIAVPRGGSPILRTLNRNKRLDKKHDKMERWAARQEEEEREGYNTELSSELDRLAKIREEARAGALDDANRGMAYGGDFDGELFNKGVDSEAGARARGLRADAIERINKLSGKLGLPEYEKQSDALRAAAEDQDELSSADRLANLSAEEDAKRAGTWANTAEFQRGHDTEAAARARGLRYQALKKAGKTAGDGVTPNTPY